MATVRRLTAILAADVAGYSRLMGADEEGTHERLKAHLRELVSPKIAEHRGRVVKNTGDGFLAEFQSVVDAVRCAVEMQRRMAERNQETPPERRIEFRIGINLGDVIADGVVAPAAPVFGTPTLYTFPDCCAGAGSGYAPVAPARRKMKSRRLIRSPRRHRRAVTAGWSGSATGPCSN
jgi:hypothetical protein